MSIGLGMIVKNAEKNLERCIGSALPLIDRWTVVDTGSTDSTKDLVRDLLGHLPGQLLESQWRGHAENRSELLAVARHGCDYVLMPDADMEIQVEAELPPLTADAYLLTIRDRGLEYPLPLLTASRKRFFYAGVAHSYLACEDDYSPDWLRELVLIDHGGGGGTPGKIEGDRDRLAAEVGKNPADARSWFYLAQSFRDLDQVPEAIAAYKMRASLGGWDEEVYQSLYQAGTLMCEHVNYYEGAKLLMAAAEMKHNRAEALRALAGCSTSVANKIPHPENEVLFVERGAYTAKPPAPPLPPKPDLSPTAKKFVRRAKITAKDVSAIIVTRGNVDLDPILATLPYSDVIVWDNSKREHDYKVFGRYAAIPEAKNGVIYWQDDDIIFDRHHDLLAAYEPGKVVANMDQPWIQGAGYDDLLVLMGAGSLCDSRIPAEVFKRYFEHHPFDDELLIEADFAFGVLAPWKRVDLGYRVREFSDDPDRLYTQPGQTERKWNMIRRCQELRDSE